MSNMRKVIDIYFYKALINFSVCGGILGFNLNTADTVTSNDLESHVTWFTPCLSPWVSHQPVVNTGCSAPTNNVCGVIEVSTAEGWVENTWGVVLEDRLVSLNSNWEWLNSKSSLHLWDVVGGNAGVTSCVDTSGSTRVVFTGSIDSPVWVSGLRFSIGGL